MASWETFRVFWGDTAVGYYYVRSDGTFSYVPAAGVPGELGDALADMGLDRETDMPIKILSEMMTDENRLPGRRQVIYLKDQLRLERDPCSTDEVFFVYRRDAQEGEPEYSPLPHDARHYEGPHTPEDMREWASWYAFRKMDDGTFQAELDEAWWWGGSHNDGGTIRTMIPEEWFELSWDEFLSEVVRLSAAAHYDFTPEILKKRDGLKEFLGF